MKYLSARVKHLQHRFHQSPLRPSPGLTSTVRSPVDCHWLARPRGRGRPRAAGGWPRLRCLPRSPARARPESPLRLVRMSGKRFGSVKRPHSRHPFLLLSRRQLYPRHFFDDLIWNRPDKRMSEFGLFFWVGKRANDRDSGPPLFNCSHSPTAPAVIHRRRGAARVNGLSERAGEQETERERAATSPWRERCFFRVPSSLCVPHAPLPIFAAVSPPAADR